MSDNEMDRVVDLKEFVDDLREEEAVVMGGIDCEDNCSYTKGYLKRQAIYTCKTCLDITTVSAAICYQCAITCHEDHDLLELYTKRHFRCDCGNNEKFGEDFKCSLIEHKDKNIENVYNKNFSGIYCTCNRPYPDEEDEEPEEMNQCVICEDWFHDKHFNLPEGVLPPDEYEELICSSCVIAHPFLLFYNRVLTEKLNTNMQENVENEDDVSEPISKCRKLEQPSKSEQIIVPCRLKEAAKKFKISFDSVNSLSILKERGVFVSNVCAIFCPPNWRTDILCHCNECKDIYNNQKIEFLLDPEDTIAHYLEVGKQRSIEFEQQETNSLNKLLSELPRPVAVDVATGINRLKSAITEFVTMKRDKDHIITAEEVRKFFAELQNSETHRSSI